MGLFFQVLASGSKGNAIFIATPRTRVLVDAGLSGRRTCQCLERAPGNHHRLDALVISHEHADHVKGVGVMSRRFDLPVFMTQGTRANLPAAVGHLARVRLFRPGEPFIIGDLRVTPFVVSHDAAEPVGFVIEHDGYRLGVCTDLGMVTEQVKRHLQGCHALVLESNHDVDRLIHGPYPRWLIDRIRSPLGHMDNAGTCDFLQSLYHENLSVVVLAHVSETNNCPSLVSRCVQSLKDSPEWSNVRFEIAAQDGGAPGLEMS
jgi:phosphoribosyl 1,2-cyclic phosphodiesterase